MSPKVSKFLLALFLVIFPLISYIYLKNGWDMGKELRAEIKDYGQMAPFSFVSHTGDTINNDFLEDKIYIADFIFTRCQGICPVLSSEMHRIQEHFKDNDRVILISHTVDPEFDSLSVLQAYAEAYEAMEDKWYFVTGTKSELHDVIFKGYRLSIDDGMSNEDITHSQRIVLVDANGHIRGYYDGMEPAEVDRLLLHADLVTPTKKEPKLKKN